ncbi:YcaO-like family protein [Melittangium boletus]|uniref:YcaO domain-containing protein n=1 Tax=Melittangium boletus DSM 14713 TaxID=1294270 RepID=A0A250I9N8_9BACT|nr:YcaO-like family protein [Melittangium boletus]ATB28589.1 hypothetical protein MEBOL_002038 [Melittangium boletus DSM 14713]
MNFKDIRDTYTRALPPGELQIFRDDALDRLGIPVVSAALRMEDGQWVPSHGYGVTEEEAVVSALGELTEEVYADKVVPTLPRFLGNYTEMVRARGLSGVVDPLTLCLPAGSPYHPGMPLTWVEMKRLSTGERVLVPEEYVATEPGQIQGATPLIRPITNGQGAGLTREQAIAHGLLELLQRDGNCVGFRAMDRGIVIDLEGADLSPAVRELLERYRQVGIEVMAKLASTDFGMANVYVVGQDMNAGDPLMVTACGEAADPDRDRALRKALLEYASSRSRKAFQHGPLENVARVAPHGYLENFLPQVEKNLRTEENRALHDMVVWAGMSSDALRAQVAITLRKERSVRLTELPQAPVAEDPAMRCAQVVRQLSDAGFDILVADLSPRDHAVHTVKVLVPGLEVETMTYYRIGERNVARLMSRGESMVGLGQPPEGTQRVRLTRAAEERLGGPAWFDVREAERRVGRLYALYREPERHSAQFVLRGRKYGGGVT